MTLTVRTLHLRDFRNYERFELEADPNLTIIVAPNASGKTNILEGIDLLTSASSFRNPLWRDVVRRGAESSTISLTAAGEGREMEIRLDIKGNQRKYSVNGKPRRKVADVRGIIPAVSFTPDDLAMVKGSADQRRSTLDTLGDQMSAAYEAIRSDYEKVLRHRNALLKNPSLSFDLFDPWTEKLVEVGVAFYSHRRRLFERIVPLIAKRYETLSGGEILDIEYVPSWGRTTEEPEEGFRRSLEEALLQERARGMTLIGPQRDEITFRIDGQDARAFASQGQQRTVTLAWKLAEITVIEDVLGKSPVLLLDDVMSELDANRREALTSFVGTKVQTFLTTTNTGYFSQELIDSAQVIAL